MADSGKTEMNVPIMDSDDEEEDAWEETEMETVQVKCLFCSGHFDSCQLVFSHCLSDHGFNIKEACNLWNLDCFGYIKMINYIRIKNPTPEMVKKCASDGSDKPPWDSDDYMRPHDPDDELLQFDIEELDLEEEGANERFDTIANGHAGDAASRENTDYQQLLQQLQMTERRLQQSEERLRTVIQDMETMKLTTRDLILSQPLSPDTNHSSETDTETGDHDDPYFSSYGHFAIHEEMLKDRVRTESYRDFLYNNPTVLKDKTVLDLGCGTGILSMFAVRGGAKHVYAVDMADIIYQAMDIARENGMSDKITFFKGKLEDITLPVEKVDIIISEWMGYFLLFESMLDSVLFARAKYLAPAGSVYPDRCTISIAALSDLDLYDKHVTYWDDVYGFKMGCMKTCVIREASVEIVDKEKVISDAAVLTDIDVGSCGLEELQFSTNFMLTFHADGPITAIIGYFDIFFEKNCTHKVRFSTGPYSIPTHWKQSVFLLDKPMDVHKGEIIQGCLSLRKNRKDPRSLIITLKLGDKNLMYHME